MAVLSVSCEPVSAADLRRIQGIYREQGAVRAVGRRFPRRHPCILSGLGSVSLFPKTGNRSTPNRELSRKNREHRGVYREGTCRVSGTGGGPCRRDLLEVRRAAASSQSRRLAKASAQRGDVRRCRLTKSLRRPRPWRLCVPRRGAATASRRSDRSSRGGSRGSRPSCEDNAIVRLSRTRRRVSLNADPRSAGAPLRR